MIFEQLNPAFCKTYLIADRENGSAVLVDPVLDHFNDYLALLKKRNFTLTHVIDTHTHADHISAGSALRDSTGCAYVMHQNAPAQCVSVRVKDGDVLTLGGIRFDVLFTPGHTGDSISLIVDGKLLTGDFLFLEDAGGGRDDLPGGSAAQHWESLSKVSELPDDLVVYPAHEYRNRAPSSLGHQKQVNPHYMERTKDEFVHYIEDFRLGPADWMKDVLKANYTCAQDPKAAWIPIDVPACEVKGTLDKGVNDIQVAYINAQELREKLNSSSKPLLLDVREPHELTSELGALGGAVNIPIGALAARLGELEPYAGSEIVVVCRSGARATTGAQILMKAAFKNVWVLKGGMLAWRQNA